MKLFNKKALAVLLTLTLLLSAVLLCGCIGNNNDDDNIGKTDEPTNPMEEPTALPTQKNTDKDYYGKATRDMVNVSITNMDLAIVKESNSLYDNHEMKVDMNGFEGVYVGDGNVYIYAFTAKDSKEADSAIENIIETFEGKTEKYIKETKVNDHFALVSAEKTLGSSGKINYNYYWTKGNLVFVVTGNGVDQDKVEEAAKGVKI